MKAVLLSLLGLIVSTSLTHADMLGVNIEFSRKDDKAEALVSIRAGYLTQYNRDNISVQEAAKVLRELRFDFDAKFAVLHGETSVHLSELMPIFEAMKANNIEPMFVHFGKSPPTGMDIWNQK